GPRLKKKSALKNMVLPQKPVTQVQGYKSFLGNNPGFSEEDFLGKVKTAFVLIQEAWAAKNLSKVRRFISDGVFQRFTTQFTMMNLLEQENRVSNIRIHDIRIDRFKIDGAYDIAHVEITASMKDQFICRTNPAFNSPGGDEAFKEYWSFIKKRGVSGHDMYQSNLCPSCDAPLPDTLGDAGKCEYCGAFVNSGQYDWVLSEITQADDYVRGYAFKKSDNLKQKAAELIAEYEDVSVQLLEDKASNGYLQIKTAWVLKDPALMRRFVSDKAYHKIRDSFSGERIVFNRLWLNDVTTIGISTSKEENRNHVFIAVTMSSQRVLLRENGKAEIIDPSIISDVEVLNMSRETQSKAGKGSLYAHICPSCGAALQNSLDVHCQYCGTELNSPKHEWIIEDIMSYGEYMTYFKTEAKNMDEKLNPQILDDLYDVKDYALNNVMILVAADGVFAAEEQEFMEKLAKRWGFNVQKIGPLFTLARSGRLALKMPEDMKKRRQIVSLMKKAAEADKNVSPEEQAIIEFMETQYLS
ncbi:MAG: hypothetical protein E4H36_11015, partial [Spirochaetales bacterium]